MAEEGDSAHLMKGTQTFDKKTDAIEEPSEEGGASTLNKVGKPCFLPVTIVERSVIAKRSAKKEEVSQLRQVDISQTTAPTWNTPTMVHYS